MPKEAQPDRAIIVGVTVVTASIRWPLKIEGQRNVYGIWVTDQAGGAHRFASHDRPEILSADGEQLNLPAELMPGSVVNLEVAGTHCSRSRSSNTSPATRLQPARGPYRPSMTFPSIVSRPDGWRDFRQDFRQALRGYPHRIDH
jgi:hypothetical protein